MKIILACCLIQLVLGENPFLKQDPMKSPQQNPRDSMFFGDMALNTKQKVALKNGMNMGGSPVTNAFAAVKGINLRWTDGIVPYEIDCSLEHLDDAVLSINQAIAEWESKTCIRFVKRTTQHKYLTFFRDTHCWGNVGMGDYTKISVGFGCEYQNVMSHEIGHALGFYHEQNRKDRDRYVKVHWENIGQHKTAFDIVYNTDSLGVAYDYESIMHYPWNAFSSNGKKTMTPVQDAYGKKPYETISKMDAQQISLMYDCPAILRKRAAQQGRKKRSVQYPGSKIIDTDHACPSWSKNSGMCCEDRYVFKHCKYSCRSAKCFTNSQCRDNYRDCPSWAKNDGCRQNPTVMKECQLSCNLMCKQPPTTQRPATQNPRTQQPRTKPPTKNYNANFLGVGLHCKDKHGACRNWAKKGQCNGRRNSPWIRKTCLLSCNSKCDKTIPTPPGQCATPLGLTADANGKYKLPDSAFYSPSFLASGGGWKAEARNARLYMEDDHDAKRIAAWCPSGIDVNSASRNYLQVDLGYQKTITYIATQGRADYFERVRNFKIEFSSDGVNFQTYKENGYDKYFDGNCDHVTPVLNKFTNPIRARYIKYIPTNWNYPCVRMELYGC